MQVASQQGTRMGYLTQSLPLQKAKRFNIIGDWTLKVSSFVLVVSMQAVASLILV